MLLRKILATVKGNPKLVALLVGLFIVQGVLQARIDPLRRDPAVEPQSIKKLMPGQEASVDSAKPTYLPFEYSLAAISGFRQVIAGLLWVRADSFFHSGNYDAILPLLRLITWLDPNWLDVYSTGAWHLMYNFTDTDQRSDRRYLPVGIALLDEGIAANSTVFDLYKEKGWNYYDKIRDYEKAVKAYEQARDNDPEHDINVVEHLLAHSLDRLGDPDRTIKAWEDAMARHKVRWDEAKGKAGKEEVESRNRQGYQSSKNNRRIVAVRKYCRTRDIARLGPVDANLQVSVTRIRPGVLQIAGSWNLEGCIKDQFDDVNFDVDGNPKTPNATGGILMHGPVDGARMMVRLQDAGYVMPEPKEFTFEVPDDLTIMQEDLNIRGGRRCDKGSLFAISPNPTADINAERAQIYNIKADIAPALKGIPVDQALASGQLSPHGQLQLVTYAYPPQMAKKKFYTAQDVSTLLAELKADKDRIELIKSKKIMVATVPYSAPGEFGTHREIDMSKDPKMYSFKKPEYDVIVAFYPRRAPDFVQDRIGWNGEGLTDKRYLREDILPGCRMLYVKLKLTRDDIMSPGKKVLFDDKTGVGLDKLQK